jgi:Asp-tRNA(Asn)/Glu-tRNA(Gln) amidotransferase A subunit family amidase
MTGPTPSRTLGQRADDAAEVIRELNHRTHRLTAELTPAEVAEILAALTAMTTRLPQLLDQLTAWLLDQHRVGRLRVDLLAPLPDAGQTVDATAAALTQATGALRRAGREIDIAHQHTAHLAQTTDPDVNGNPLSEQMNPRWPRPVL